MLEIKNLSIRYKNTDSLVLDDISFQINSNQKIAILGPSGCGKTTLINAISDILDTETSIGGSIIKKEITTAVVFQTPCLLQWKNVYENIVFAFGNKKYNKEEIYELIRLVGLEGYEKHHPNELSIGMQQRVNFVRALAIHPNLILLDEPFSALDDETKEAVIQTFKKVLDLKKIACLLVTHNEGEALKIVDQLIYLTQKPTTIKEIVAVGKKIS